ncbi:YveK family protein [Cellulomonas marina]|uniref:Capsular polysaccharide biosynthesis protein n=1 Tax=Cellulomonas marina TaxID=988821 RepID=A0A1I0X0M7_9CELL|nr:Wzz/FepE/Etk N-terminal domain-containing protein [Cellulomonas marina]GIG29365.1 hypothetical protein Cma02nite_19650 [Cellulomonas marina]SFA94572.1 Capsular polysaccharide biosynthesis protein [Cellulomonas marina]
MTLQDFFQAVRRRWWVVAACLVVGLVVASILAATTPQRYRASSQLYVSVSGATTASELATASTYARQQAPAFASLVGSTAVLEGVSAGLGGSRTADELRGTVAGSASDGSPIIVVSALAPSADEAVQVVDLTTENLIATAQELAGTAPTSAAALQFTVIQPGQSSGSPVTPNWELNLALGALAGLVVGLLLVAVSAVGRVAGRRVAEQA